MRARIAPLSARPIRPVKSDKTCNARKKSGGVCRKPAGWGTDHLGQGRCRRHGGNVAKRTIKFGHYSLIQHDRIKNVLERLSTVEMNALDLMPEVNMLRAMTIDYVNRYEEFVEAMMAWYADPDTKARPRRVMDIQDASHLVESISRVAQRMHQIQSEGAISLETFKRVTEHMGVIVAKHVSDPLVLNRIEQEWMELALDTKSPPSVSTESDSSKGE